MAWKTSHASEVLKFRKSSNARSMTPEYLTRCMKNYLSEKENLQNPGI
jgi:hypothetical protein